MLFGRYDRKIPVKLYTDSKLMLESIGSTHQIEEKQLRNGITDIKDMFSEGKISAFCWLDRDTDMVADALTKETKFNMDLISIVIDGRFRSSDKEDNMVICDDGEVKMIN
jgi:hypothetical protein